MESFKNIREQVISRVRWNIFMGDIKRLYNVDMLTGEELETVADIVFLEEQKIQDVWREKIFERLIQLGILQAKIKS